MWPLLLLLLLLLLLMQHCPRDAENNAAVSCLYEYVLACSLRACAWAGRSNAQK